MRVQNTGSDSITLLLTDEDIFTMKTALLVVTITVLGNADKRLVTERYPTLHKSQLNHLPYYDE